MAVKNFFAINKYLYFNSSLLTVCLAQVVVCIRYDGFVLEPNHDNIVYRSMLLTLSIKLTYLASLTYLRENDFSLLKSKTLLDKTLRSKRTQILKSLCSLVLTDDKLLQKIKRNYYSSFTVGRGDKIPEADMENSCPLFIYDST